MSAVISPNTTFSFNLQSVIAGAGLLLALAGIVYSAGFQSARIEAIENSTVAKCSELDRRITRAETQAEPVAPALARISERLLSIDQRLGRMEASP